jgi:hypothetical protein
VAQQMQNPQGAMPPDAQDSSPDSGADPKQQKLYDSLLSGLLEFVWGKGQPDIQRQIQRASKDTLATVIGHIVFALVQQGADQAEQRGFDLSADMLMGVATEMIESLEKMAAAMNIKFDAKAIGLQALVQALNDYAQSLPPGSQAQQDAQDALKQFGQQNINTAAATVQEIGEKNGVNPFAQAGQGAPAAAPPASQPQGLMGAAS